MAIAPDPPINAAVPQGPAAPVPAERNLLADAGLVLSNVAAGARGQPLPSVALDAARQEQAARAEKTTRDRAIFGMQVTAQLNASIEKLTDPEQITALIGQYNEAFAESTGIADFTNFAQRAASLPISAGDLATIVGDPEAAELFIRMANNDPDVLQSLYENEDLVARTLENIDNGNRERYLAHLDGVLDVLQDPQTSTPELEQFIAELDKDETGNLILTEADMAGLNEALPENLDFNESEFNFI